MSKPLEPISQQGTPVRSQALVRFGSTVTDGTSGINTELLDRAVRIIADDEAQWHRTTSRDVFRRWSLDRLALKTARIAIVAEYRKALRKP